MPTFLPELLKWTPKLTVLAEEHRNYWYKLTRQDLTATCRLSKSDVCLNFDSSTELHELIHEFKLPYKSADLTRYGDMD